MTPLLQIDHVTHYFGGLCAVNDFNLELNKGELVGIIGPNGAGKTTIFNLITGVYKATKGSIKLNSEELVGMKPNQITTKGIARTFQNIRLFKDLTVLDNVRIAFYGQLHTTPVSALLGLKILEFFGISLASFQVGGGLLLLMSAIQMLNAQPANRAPTTSTTAPAAPTPAPASRSYRSPSPC